MVQQNSGRKIWLPGSLIGGCQSAFIQRGHEHSDHSSGLLLKHDPQLSGYTGCGPAGLQDEAASTSLAGMSSLSGGKPVEGRVADAISLTPHVMVLHIRCAKRSRETNCDLLTVVLLSRSKQGKKTLLPSPFPGKVHVILASD